MEKWLPIAGYESIYEVSSLGRVRRISLTCKLSEDQVLEIRRLRKAENYTYEKLGARFGVSLDTAWHVVNRPYSLSVRKTGRILKPSLTGNGYPFVSLCKGGKVKLLMIHRLTAEAFIGPIPKGLTVNHINGIRSDGRIENLEIATYVEQSRHARDILGFQQKGPRGERARTAKLKNEDIPRIRSMNLSPTKIAALYGVCASTIHAVLSRKTWSHIN